MSDVTDRTNGNSNSESASHSVPNASKNPPISPNFSQESGSDGPIDPNCDAELCCPGLEDERPGATAAVVVENDCCYLRGDGSCQKRGCVCTYAQRDVWGCPSYLPTTFSKAESPAAAARLATALDMLHEIAGAGPEPEMEMEAPADSDPAPDSDFDSDSDSDSVSVSGYEDVDIGIDEGEDEGSAEITLQWTPIRDSYRADYKNYRLTCFKHSYLAKKDKPWGWTAHAMRNGVDAFAAGSYVCSLEEAMRYAKAYADSPPIASSEDEGTCRDDISAAAGLRWTKEREDKYTGSTDGYYATCFLRSDAPPYLPWCWELHRRMMRFGRTGTTAPVASGFARTAEGAKAIVESLVRKTDVVWTEEYGGCTTAYKGWRLSCFRSSLPGHKPWGWVADKENTPIVAVGDASSIEEAQSEAKACVDHYEAES